MKGGKQKILQFMWFGDGNTVWQRETRNSEIAPVVMKSCGENLWPFFLFSPARILLVLFGLFSVAVLQRRGEFRLPGRLCGLGQSAGTRGSEASV